MHDLSKIEEIPIVEEASGPDLSWAFEILQSLVDTEIHQTLWKAKARGNMIRLFKEEFARICHFEKPIASLLTFPVGLEILYVFRGPFYSCLWR